MAIAVDSSSAGQTFSNVSSSSWTHTVSGSNRVAYVCVCWSSGRTITAITFGGVAMSLVGTYMTTGFGGTNGYISLYRVTNPSLGDNTVSITYSGANYGVAGSISLTGVDQTTPESSAQNATGTSTAPSVTKTLTTSDNLVLGSFLADFGLSSTGVTAGRDLSWSAQERPNTGYSGGLEYATSGGGSEVMGWTINASKKWIALGIEVFAAPLPVNTVAPVVSGTAQVGQTLTCSTGTWTNSPTGYSYQWKSNGSNVGADQDAYVTVADDVGNTIQCVVTASNADGSGEPANSNTTSEVLPAAPVNTVPPAVTPSSGNVGDTFTCDTGTWTGEPTGYAYQWKLDGENVGTNQNTYVPVAAGELVCEVTASNAGGPSDPETSNAVTVEEPPPAIGGSLLLLLGS